MVDAKENKEATKSKSGPGKDSVEKEEAPAVSLSSMDEEEYEEEDEYEEEEDEEAEEDEEEEENNEEQPEEEKASNGGNATVVVNKEQPETHKQNAVKEDEKKQIKEDEKKPNAVKEDEKKPNAVKEDEKKQNAVKEDKKPAKEPKSGKQPAKESKSGEKPSKEPKSGEKPAEDSKSKEKRPKSKTKKREQKDSGIVNGDKPESSSRKKGSKRVESMGMVFMCSSKTKADCFRYKILGLPESKKDQVLKIYRGMRLFLFDVDLRLMYGIFKAAGPGGYNIEPEAFKSEFPSQVRFTVMDDCLPVAEELFKDVLKENYYSRNKFEGLLKGDQVKRLCKLFVVKGRGGGSSRSKSAVKLRRIRGAEPRRTRREEESRRDRLDDRRTSRDREKRKRWGLDEERRPRSRSPLREKRRYADDYDRDRLPVGYDRELPVPRYLPPQPAAMGSPVRLYAYERPPLDIPPPYVRDRLPEPSTYRVMDRDRDPYLREPPLYRDAVYPAPPVPEYHHLVSREYHQAPEYEYRVAGGSRVPDYRDVEMAGEYRSSAVALPEYRSRTHYKY